jgi:hypothetical protein
VTSVSNAATSRHSLVEFDASRAVDNVHAVKVKVPAVVGPKRPVTAVIVEGFNPAVKHRYEPSEPWRSTDTISSAVVAASRPLLFSSLAERTNA